MREGGKKMDIDGNSCNFWMMVLKRTSDKEN